MIVGSASFLQAHTRAITQPIPVAPKKRFKRKIESESFLFLAIIEGRKYRKIPIMNIRINTNKGLFSIKRIFENILLIS